MKVASVLLSHPFGNPNCHNAVLALQGCQCLDAFWTSVFAPLGIPKRFHPQIRRDLVRTRPLPEAIRLLATLLPVDSWNGRNARWADWLWRNFDESVAENLSSRTTAVYAYEDGAFATFVRARSKGIRSIYELPATYFEEVQLIQNEEVRRDPSFSAWMRALKEPEWKLQRKYSEIGLADVIVVPSNAVKKSILSHRQITTPIVVVPYGADLSVESELAAKPSKKVRLFFAGRLEPSKGIHYLFEALSKFDSGAFDLTLAGVWTQGFREFVMSRWRVHFSELGFLSRPALLNAYHQYDVFVFPSLHEGLALALLEAMGAGLPIAASDRSGAADLITDGQEGFTFKAASAESIVNTLNRVLSCRDQLVEMGRLARRRARAASWPNYRNTLVERLGSYLD